MRVGSPSPNRPLIRAVSLMVPSRSEMSVRRFASALLALFLAVARVDAIVLHPQASGWRVNFTYHSYNDLSSLLRQFTHFYPGLVTLYSIGRSVKQKELWVLRVTSPESGIVGTPNIRFIGNVHGNEPVGRELIVHLAEYLLKSYQTDDEVRWLLDNTVIHLLPSLNPDGFERSDEGDCHSLIGRVNGNFVDLNRSFPDFFRENRIPIQPETEAVMRWMRKIPFVLSGSFHGGALVVSYPYENDAESSPPKYSATPDDDTFRHLAEVYAGSHSRMRKGSGCHGGASFPGGITNGAAWYKITGGMPGYGYMRHGCMELTLEVSCCKYPPSRELASLWNENRKAMLELAKAAHRGVRGIVMDSMTGSGVPGAALMVLGRSVNFTSSRTGEFWRILLPGDYILRAEAEGYRSQQFPFSVRNVSETHPESTWLNVYLVPENVTITSGSIAVRVSVSLVALAVSLLQYQLLR